MSAGSLPLADPATHSRRLLPFLIACCVFLVLMEMLGAHTSRDPKIATDFRQFYAAGNMIRTDPAHLYDLVRQKQVQDALVSPQNIPLPFVHPSYEALLAAPFALLPYRPAYLAFIAFNVLLLVAIFFAARPIFSARIPFLLPVPGFIFFLYIPAVVAIWQGQDSIIFLLLCCLAWRALDAQRDALGGALLALCLFRFQLAIPIAILLAIRRNWRFSATFLATAAALALLSIGIVGLTGSLQFIHLLSAVSLSGDQGANAQFVFAMHPYAMPNLFGLLFALGTGHLPARAGFLVALTAYSAVFLYASYSVWHSRSLSSTFSIAILCAVLVSHHLYLHDATLLLLPIVLLAASIPRPVLLSAYFLPLALFFFVGPNSLFLMALSTLALLFFAAKIEQEPQPMPPHAATPLYTQS